MIQTKHIINSLPLIADVLGRKYGIQVRIGGTVACTNGKVIYLPSLPLDSGITALNMARGFIDHESAHLRESDFRVFSDNTVTPQEKFVCNLLEDYRVEQKLQAVYPGCRHNLHWLIRHFHLNCDNEQYDSATRIFVWMLTYLRTRDVPELAEKKDRLAQELDKDYPGLGSTLEAVLDTVPAECKSTSDCLVMARNLLKIISDYQPPPSPEPAAQPDQEDTIPERKTGDSETSASDNNAHQEARKGDDAIFDKQADNPSSGPSGDPIDAPSDPSSDLSSGPSGDQAGDSNSPSGQMQVLQNGAEPETSGDENSPTDRLRALLDSPAPDLPQNLGEHLAQALRDRDGRQDGRLTVATAGSRQMWELTADEIQAARRTTTALRTRLQALLQSTVLRRTHISRTGRIDTRHISRLSLNDPRVFLKNEHRQGISAAVHILLDASGSMSGKKMQLASEACFAIASALHVIKGVGVAVTSFPCPIRKPPAGTSQDQFYAGQTVSPVLKFRQKLHACFHTKARGNTPMDSALWWAMQQMYALHEERKIILIVSDGDPDLPQATANAIKAASAQGFEVYGIGIDAPYMSRLLPPKHSLQVNSLHELAPAMFDILRNALTRQNKGRSV